MKIMITGSHGQLGNELISCLKTGKSEIGEIPAMLLGCEILPVDIDELDIIDLAAVRKFIDKNKGCDNCISDECGLPMSEDADYLLGKKAGYYCINYKSPYDKK